MKKRFYTVASGERFIRAAVRSINSFFDNNKEIEFNLFILGDFKGAWIKGLHQHTKIKHIQDYDYVDKEFLKVNKYYNILYFKFCIAPLILPEEEGMTIFVDADTYCNKPLPFENIELMVLDNLFIGAGDPMREKRLIELRQSPFHDGIVMDGVYFNSGVFIYNSMEREFFENFKTWVDNNFNNLSKCKFGDQTWLNIFMNKGYRYRFIEIGSWWNWRGVMLDDRCYIWHAGGRDSEGIENIENYCNKLQENK